MIDVDDDDEEINVKHQHVAALRDEGRTYYINGAYRNSVLSYTAAISAHTNNVQFDHLQSTKNDSTLAALFGNRAAALMMTGAYIGASADCDRALSCTEANSNGVAYGSLESGPSFRSKILCRMARALLKAGSIWEADRAFSSSIQSAKEAMAIVESVASSGGLGADGNEEMRSIEKILSQSITDATLGLTDVKRCRDALESAKVVEATKGLSPAADRRKNVELLMFINSALSVSPGSMELHERKVNALALLKRWAELGNHCERLAAEIVKVDGLFTSDLASLNPFPDVRPATALKADFFERNADDILDPVSLRILSPKAVCDAVIRLPNGILPLYLRSLRLEERYTEAAKAGASIELHMTKSKHKGGRGNVSVAWLSSERDKLRRTMSWKEQGDTLFRNGDYERAAEKYAQCLTIDNDGSVYNENALENDDSGGRLHAVLHCNRAACLMALKKYREAVKECTAALRIHTHYMKAMLRRGRCFARIRQYHEAIAEYERYIQLVNEARRLPQSAANSNNAACTFDRPIDIAEAEYTKAKQELADVKKSMRQADTNDHAQKKKQREQQSIFNKNFKAAANDAARRRQEVPPGMDTAYVRKKQWDAAGNNQRPWDTFGGASPKKTTSKQKSAAKEEPKPIPGAGRNMPRKNQSKPSTQQQPPPPQQQQSQHQQQQQPLIGKVTDASDHYQVLGLTHGATSAEIKKGYHKAALKYHPDKNSDEGAADMFRRIKLAYEVLGNDQSRMSYDAHRRLNSNRR
jgi:tetratricopeptide (TPR) repeat protein